jgi:DnaJ-class molecular chaperone
MANKFRTGNVVRLKSGSIVIVTKVTDDYTHWISFDYANSSGGTKNITYDEITSCWDCDESDETCETCHGTGEYTRTVYGMDEAVRLADNVKEFIIKGLTKNFGF